MPPSLPLNLTVATSMKSYFDIFPRMPREVVIGDVSIRDGFQAEEKNVSTKAKIFYLSEIVFAGCRHIEVTNLGKNHIMPQFADAEEVMSYARSDFFKERCQRKGVDYDDICFTCVTIRETAVDHAIRLKQQGIGPDRILMMISTDEHHHFVNTGTTINEYWKEAERCISKCHNAGIQVCGTVSTIWGSPIVGPMDMRKAVDFVRIWLDLGVNDIEHSDHDGSGTADQIYGYFSEILDAYPDPEIHIAHFHETKRIGSASILASLQAGIKRYEASLGGIGGQPANFFDDFPVPGTGKYYHVRPGVVPLEDTLIQLDEMGIRHNYNIDRILELGRLMERTLGRTLKSDAIWNGRSLQAPRLDLARPGLLQRKQKLGELPPSA